MRSFYIVATLALASAAAVADCVPRYRQLVLRRLCRQGVSDAHDL